MTSYMLCSADDVTQLGYLTLRKFSIDVHAGIQYSPQLTYLHTHIHNFSDSLWSCFKNPTVYPDLSMATGSSTSMAAIIIGATGATGKSLVRILLQAKVPLARQDLEL